MLQTLLTAPVLVGSISLLGCGAEDPETLSNDGGSCDATRSDVEGPFYTANAPTRAALADENEPGERIRIEGNIVDATDCATGLGGYTLDLWHADDAGVYDNEGFKLRGKTTAADDGSFVIDTVMPGSYPDRPVRHIHLKIRHPDGRELLTTQIYFEGDPELDDRHSGPRVALLDGVGQLDFAVSV